MKAGIDLTLDPGERRIYRAKVIPVVDDPGEACLAGGFAIEPGNLDAVGIVYINSTSICG